MESERNRDKNIDRTNAKDEHGDGRMRNDSECEERLWKRWEEGVECEKQKQK